MKFGIAAVLALVSFPATAQTMNAETFNQRIQALKAKGAMALFSGDEIKALTAEGQAAGKAARAQQAAAAKAGQKPRFCPPDGPQKMGSDEFMTRLAAIPQAERQKIDMTEAMTRMLAVKFPCKTS